MSFSAEIVLNRTYPELRFKQIMSDIMGSLAYSNDTQSKKCSKLCNSVPWPWERVFVSEGLK